MPASVELVGAQKIANDMRALGERLPVAGSVLESEMLLLEQAESLLFESFGGKYTRTGRLRASLTQPDAADAIRRIHGNVIEFGTKVWYARFQTKIGPPSGVPRGRKRPLPVKVLKLTPALRRQAAQLVMDRVMGRV